MTSTRNIAGPPKLGVDDRSIDAALVESLLPRRSVGDHKWGVGGLVIVAGSPGFTGAAVLSTMAAGRAGAGIVNVACSRAVGAAVVAAVPEAATIPLPESEVGGASKRALENFEEKLEKSAALLVGPGLGDDEVSNALLRSLFGGDAVHQAIGFGFSAPSPPDSAEHREEGGLIARSGKPVVIDADALNWLAQQEAWIEWLPPGRAVLTPHVGEMARLLSVEADQIVAEPLATVREAAHRWRQVVVLKYGYAVVSDGERTLVANDAPPSLATAGSGDVLAGTIAALLAQGLNPMDASALAIFVGCRAARRVERRFGELGLVAGDLPPAIAEELAALAGDGANANG